MTWRDEYERAIRSPHWRNLRRAVGKMRGETCERCKRQTLPLDLHHKTYERLGRERPQDVELLCTQCHYTADREREARSRVRSEEARKKARLSRALDTYATKKYGEDWQDRYDSDRIVEEFEEWRERREDYY